MTDTPMPAQPKFRDDVTVELVKASASDADVLFAARVSTLGERSFPARAMVDLEHTAVEHPQTARDRGLINYLMRDRHGSPWEHTSMTFFISAPIFVFREFMRHRAGWSYNEESGRYRELEPVFYWPGEDRKLVQQGKSGRYEFVDGPAGLHDFTRLHMEVAYREAYAAYEAMLAAGVAREVARSVLPVGLYSSMYATCNARSLMHFLGLRTTHPDAKVPSFPQREIEMVGELMEAHWAGLMPLTHAAFNTNGRVAP
ncbi:FAD-dependent thymidylate synthase [Streptomyces californicus]|uniref:FAD-dependent thymidylate synthase n=1 Tax=Streptomyces californicus TaxID=67351 RepID=UPI0004BE4E3B|nr:FAD-dependent thymidylate synthase [Streptomyces californicus]QRV59440.1 FAD-dependent thymidylate synthase [Streptomyces californicus]